MNVMMFVRGRDSPDGEHGIHIHEVATCEPYGDTGGHFDQGPKRDSNLDRGHPFHLGDLVNMEARDDVGMIHQHNTCHPIRRSDQFL